MSERNVVLNLTRPEALVLFEWLARAENSRLLRFEDEAEQKVLWTLEAQLEKLLTEPLSPDYDRLLSEARAQVRSG